MNWLKTMLSDIDGDASSKRVITFLAFIVCAWGFVADAYGYNINPSIFDSMMYIVVAGLGFTASEKFTKKDTK